MPSTPPRRPKVTMACHQHRILIYTTCYNVLDGVTLTIRKIEQEILAAGHHVCIVSTESGDPKNTHMDGEHPNRSVIFLDNSIPIPFLNDPNNPELSYHLGFALSKAVKKRITDFEPSLIHITVPDCTCLHLVQYARDREIPLMGTYHSNIPEYMNHYPGLGWLKHILSAFFRHQYNFLQALYVPTPFIQRHLTETSRMDKVTKLKVWGRGIDLERFSPKHRSQQFRQELGFSDSDVVICWVGRLVPEKRPDIFCYVIRKLHERGIPFRAMIVGAGPCEDEMKTLPNTRFVGWLSGDDLAVAYASSDVFLFPSAVETFGNVSLEAAASGLPIVVEGGCSGHLVNHGLNGYACHEDDFDAYYEGVRCLVTDHAGRKRMSEEGRKFSLQFEKKVVCQKMLENYSTVTEEFYCQYGGRHANRDKAYRTEHSFLAGNHPRPFVLILVEYVFVVLFMILWQLASLLSCVKEMVFSSPAAGEAEISRAKISTPLLSGEKATDVPVAWDAPLVSIEEVEDYDDSDTEAQEGASNECGPLMKADDDTDSTVSLSDDSISAKKSESICCRSRPNSFLVSHALAIGFVKLIQCQAKIESWLRNRTNDCCSPSSLNIMRRKRKNSSFALESTSSPLDISDNDLSIPDDLELLVNARDERLNMRRSSTLPLDL